MHFHDLVRPELPRLHGLALRLSRDPEGAEDLLQSALEQGLRRFGQLRDPGAFRVWMSRIVVRTWQNGRARKRPDQVALHEVPVHDDTVARREAGGRIHQALAELPEAQRIAVWMIDGLGYRFGEAAEILAISPGTVASRVARGRSALRVTLGDLATSGGLR